MFHKVVMQLHFILHLLRFELLVFKGKSKIIVMLQFIEKTWFKIEGNLILIQFPNCTMHVNLIRHMIFFLKN